MFSFCYKKLLKGNMCDLEGQLDTSCNLIETVEDLAAENLNCKSCNLNFCKCRFKLIDNKPWKTEQQKI